MGTTALAVDRHWTSRAATLLRRRPALPARDVFDRLAASRRAPVRWSPAVRLVIAVLVVAALGVPSLTTARAVLFAVLRLAIVFGAAAINARRFAGTVWRPARYTRQVDRIDFRSLREFRGGFAKVAAAALSARAPMLFVVATPYRYAMLAWDVSVLVLLVRLVAGIDVVPAGVVAPSPTPAVAVPMPS